MITLSELWRRVQNIVVTAKVVKTQASDGKALVQVLYTDKETGEEHISKFLPVVMKNNSLMKIWMPVLKDEQVIVFRPFGDNDGGFVFASLFWKGSKEPAGANEHVAIVAFSDGCVIKYDTQSKELSVDSCNKIRFVCDEFECTGDAMFGANVDVAEALDVGGDADFGASVQNNGVDIGESHTHMVYMIEIPTGIPE